MSKKSLTSSPGIFGELWQQAKLALQLFVDPKVPIYLKLLPIAAVGYLIFPIDFLPDVVPGIGQLDDITILLLGAKLFISLAPQDVVDKYINKFRASAVPDDVDVSAVKDSKKSEDGDDIIEGIIIEDDSVESSSA